MNISTYYVKYKDRKDLLNKGSDWFLRFKLTKVFGKIQFNFGILGFQIWNEINFK
jgi:hypothetical protein